MKNKISSLQYKKFISVIDVIQYPKEELLIENYWRNIQILKLVAVCFIVINTISFLLHFEFASTIQRLTFIYVLIYVGYRKKASKKILDILLEKCDPERALAAYANLISYAKSQSNWEQHFYNLGSILYYAGRIDDVKKTLSLMKEYCPNDRGKMYYEMIASTLVLDDMNQESLKHHCENMKQLSNTVRLKGKMKYIYYEKMQYPALIQMWNNGNFQELYDAILNAKNFDNTTLSKVKKNYYLYQVAKALGNDDKMIEHRDYVVKNGNGLWYCKELKKSVF